MNLTYSKKSMRHSIGGRADLENRHSPVDAVDFESGQNSRKNNFNAGSSRRKQQIRSKSAHYLKPVSNSLDKRFDQRNTQNDRYNEVFKENMYYDNTSHKKRNHSPNYSSKKSLARYQHADQYKGSNSPMKSSLKKKSSFVRYDYSSAKKSPRYMMNQNASNSNLNLLMKNSSRKGVTFLNDFYNSRYPTPDTTMMM